MVELLVAIVVIGLLAGIAMPSLLNQKSKGNDAEAKSAAVTASQAMEECATQHGGSYAGCSKEELLSLQPALRDVESRLIVAPEPNRYNVAVVSNRDSNVSFAVHRSPDGTTSRTCTVGTAERGGCKTPATGVW